MDSAGLSVGGVASVGFGAGVGAFAPATAQFVGPPPPPGTIAVAAAAEVVVTISDRAIQALALDAMNNLSSSQLRDDLAALALLAILERDRQQSDPLVSAAVAINAYLAMQAMGSGG
jgi:hypothetical protein